MAVVQGPSGKDLKVTIFGMMEVTDMQAITSQILAPWKDLSKATGGETRTLIT